MRQKISVVTIAKNEEKNLSSFLEKVNWADEVILIDNDSRDKTVDVASGYGVNVYNNSSNNLGILKNFGISKTTKDWVLVLDVDEHVSPTLKKEILTLLNEKIDFNGFSIPYKNHFLGHLLKTKAQIYAKVRLFKREKGKVENDAVHEEMKITGNIGKLTGYIYHYSFRSISQTIKKFTDYARRESPALYSKREKATLRAFVLNPLHMFITLFFDDKGYKDGIYGFLLALCFAYYEFARYYFLLLYQIKNKR